MFPALAVIVAVPTLIALTTPFSTVATEASEVVQVTVLSVALLGLTVAVRVSLLPFSRISSVLFSDTDVAGTTTVTMHSADTSPAVAVIVAVPAEIALTVPYESTYAMVASELLQLTVLSVALEGVTVAVRVWVWPTLRVVDDEFKLIPATGITFAVTVTVQVAVLAPSFVLTVIVALPADLAVTTPEEETVATVVLLEVQVTD